VINNEQPPVVPALKSERYQGWPVLLDRRTDLAVAVGDAIARPRLALGIYPSTSCSI